MRRIKVLAWRGLCHLAFWSGVGPVWAAIRRHRRDRWTILTYHRIGRPEQDGGPDQVSAERFRRQLRYLRRRYDIIPVGEAMEKFLRGAGGSRPLLSLTFDDGYRDNVLVALPILLSEGCRATLYPTVEAVRDGLPPWTHRLAVDLLASSGARGGPAVVRAEVRRAKALPDEERARLCAAAEAGSGGAGRRAAPMVRPEDLERWRDAGMEIGSHTATHRILSRLPAGERKLELQGSRDYLQRLLGTPVQDLAYPNGGHEDWDADIETRAREAGYLSAVTTLEGLNDAELDPMAIRRLPGADDSLPVFAMRVSGLLGALRGRFSRRARATGAARPIRIAFIGGRGVGSAYSGIERYYEEVGSRLVDLGHQVTAYSRSHFTPDVESFRGVQVRRIPTLRLKHLETFVHSALATLDVCFRKVDLVQFHALGSSPLAWLPRLCGKKTIVSVRGLDWQRAKWGGLARAYLRFCEKTSILCPNATGVVSQTLKRHYAEAHGVTVRYIPNGVEHHEGHPADWIRSLGLGPRDYFLYAGRLSPEKGLECLIEAHRRVGGSALLAIAGGTSYSDRYIEGLKRVAGPRVVFTGFQTGSRLEELYANALAFVLPSHMEGLSVALLEAMSYGLPVITSDIPENRELVDACGGWLFPTDDADALAALLARMVNDKESAREAGRACRDEVRRRFDWDRVAEETERFYLDVLGRPGMVRRLHVDSASREASREPAAGKKAPEWGGSLGARRGDS